ncbi:MAG: sulfotransferase [Halioglobus sp.]
MSFARAKLPLPVRLFNGGIGALRKTGLNLISLDPDALMKKACNTTGLNDFGPDYFRDPMKRLCQSLNEDARLTGLGRTMARQDILRLLEHRLLFIDQFKRHPEIAEQEIIAPIFILGMPRTGTTSLHELMALDPQFRVPLSWELAYPFPPPETATYTTDPRIAKVDAELARVDSLLPDFRHMHPMGAQLPQECVALFNHDFASMIFDVQFRVRSYQQWLVQEDMTAVFHNHRRWLQLLQWRCPGKTWVLKSPQYLWNIQDMLREYPDARVVQTHRDPVKVAVSVASLTATLRSLGSNDISLPEIARDYIDLMAYGNSKTLEARDQVLIAADKIIDVQFSNFRQDPVSRVREIYDFFSLEKTEHSFSAMQDFLAAGQESERHGKHKYNFADTELDLATERKRFADYQRRYGVQTEET